MELSIIGLCIIAVGSGGLKACIFAFGGDQFKLPEQHRQLQTFFSILYFAANLGGFLSAFVTPILRFVVD